MQMRMQISYICLVSSTYRQTIFGAKININKSAHSTVHQKCRKNYGKTCKKKKLIYIFNMQTSNPHMAAAAAAAAANSWN